MRVVMSRYIWESVCTMCTMRCAILLVLRRLGLDLWSGSGLGLGLWLGSNFGQKLANSTCVISKLRSAFCKLRWLMNRARDRPNGDGTASIESCVNFQVLCRVCTFASLYRTEYFSLSLIPVLKCQKCYRQPKNTNVTSRSLFKLYWLI